MKTYRFPLMILAALVVLAVGAATASAVHYVAVRSGDVLGARSPATSEAPALLADDAPAPGCVEVRLETTLETTLDATA